MFHQKALKFVIWNCPRNNTYRIKFVAKNPNKRLQQNMCAYIYLLFDAESIELKRQVTSDRCINVNTWNELVANSKRRFYYENSISEVYRNKTQKYKDFKKFWLSKFEKKKKTWVLNYLRNKRIPIVYLQVNSRPIERFEENNMLNLSAETVIINTGIDGPLLFRSEAYNNFELEFKEILPAVDLSESNSRSSHINVTNNEHKNTLNDGPSVSSSCIIYDFAEEPYEELILPLVPVKSNIKIGSLEDYYNRIQNGLISNSTTYDEFIASLALLNL